MTECIVFCRQCSDSVETVLGLDTVESSVETVLMEQCSREHVELALQQYNAVPPARYLARYRLGLQ